MSYFKVFYTRDNQPAYWIGKALSKEDAIKKADVLPSLIYDVWLLNEWQDECDSRRGVYSDLLIKNNLDSDLL